MQFVFQKRKTTNWNKLYLVKTKQLIYLCRFWYTFKYELQTEKIKKKILSSKGNVQQHKLVDWIRSRNLQND